MSTSTYTTDRIIQEMWADVEYYYVIRKNDGEWVPIIRPFIKTKEGSSGEFITANWFKAHIPKSLEYAILKINTEYTTTRSKSVKTTFKILDYIEKISNCSGDINTLDFVIMSQQFNNDYLKTIESRLTEKLGKENTDTTSLHITMPNKRGTFGMTFGLRKGERPCMYCPCFDLYP